MMAPIMAVASAPSVNYLSNAWEVFLLFVIPVGGGIPGGVVLAKARGIAWPVMMLLYFISDLALACVFEPLMLLMIAGGKRSKFVMRVNEAMRKSMQKTTDRYGVKLGPMQLILIAFGVDPMTGRSAAKAAGHGFISGWTLAIAGDMIFFTVLMVSTLLLNNILGDGTWTTIIMMVAMFVVPTWIKKAREKWASLRTAS
jgi:hypothetical protein